jgi:diguanylate cyclase (GGDEF)-like protein
MKPARTSSRSIEEWVLRSLFREAPDFLLVLDPDLRITRCGAAFHSLTGIQESAGVPFEDTIEKFSLSKVRPIFDALRSGESSHATLRVFHHTTEGSSLPVAYHWVCGTGGNGELLGFVGIGREAADLAVEHEVRKLQNEIQAARSEAERRGRDAARLARQVEAEAMKDQLTGLVNRRYILERLSQEMTRAIRYDEPLSLLLLDIDALSRVNDDEGRTRGDDVIRRVAEIVQGQVRGSDIASRYEGGQFLILSPHTDRPSAQFLAERLRRRVAEIAFPGNERDFCVTISVGIVSVSGQNEFGVEAVLQAVEQALEAAKTGGRNRVQLLEVH